MKFISWNVNGLRAAVGKGFTESFFALDADLFSVQETKLQSGQIDIPLNGYRGFWNYAERKGYSGTAVFAKREPISVSYGIGIPEHDTEGRTITLDMGGFFLVNVYTPNSGDGLKRLTYRLEWEREFLDYILKLDSEKPVVICGDMNVAHQEIDIKNPYANRHNAGFTDEERACFTKLLSCGFVDTFRYLHPDARSAYTWWSYRFNARANNAGWRIDYFVVSDRLRDRIISADIYPDVFGSDHCPVGLELDID